jgi:hypothetical protein
VVIDRFPSSIHRRTVSSLTPSSSAASLIRIVGTDGSYPQNRRQALNISADAEMGW